jgi:hypothetical protein
MAEAWSKEQIKEWAGKRALELDKEGRLFPGECCVCGKEIFTHDERPKGRFEGQWPGPDGVPRFRHEGCNPVD